MNLDGIQEKNRKQEEIRNEPEERHSSNQQLQIFQEMSDIDLKINQFAISQNSRNYPYFRAHHYFFLLDTFPRASIHPDFNTIDQAPGSYSYALDSDNRFRSTFRHQNNKNGDLTIGQLLNRKLFGCPPKDNYTKQQTKDKNPCHRFLFSNQDRKYQIDQIIYQYKKIVRNLDHLKNTEKLKYFSSIQDDMILQKIKNKQFSLQQSKELLQQRILLLERKKGEIQFSIMKEDNFFYEPSLKQNIYNQIQSKSEKLTITQILRKIFQQYNLRGSLITNSSNKYSLEDLKQLLYYFNTTHPCISEKALAQFAETANQSFTRRQQNGQFKIQFPLTFFSFHNEKLLELTQKLVTCKLVNQNERCFYIFKALWNKITGRNLNLLKVNYIDRYLTYFEQIASKLALENIQNETQQQNYPILDNLITLGQLKGQVTDYIFPRKGQSEISPREQILVFYFYHLYTALNGIFDFVDNNPLLIELMSLPLYEKYQHILINIVKKPEFGLIFELLQRIYDFTMRQELEIDLKFSIVYNKDKKVAYIYRMSDEEDWQSDNPQESLHEDEQQIVDKLQKKPKYQ